MMEGFALIMGHLFGDIMNQRDWEAALKGAMPPTEPRPPDDQNPNWVMAETVKLQLAWDAKVRAARKAKWACTFHCLMYTLTVFVFTSWFLPWWAYTVIFGTHWAIDRYGLARRLMRVNGQERFATGMFSTWSVVAVDQCMHLLVLYVLGICHHVMMSPVR